ncbi:MAG: hypothetical protein K5985_05360 [Lachnospiraceae bacterium]|nr:hypothetical protein [Lachnospiraceae bacterium]
MENKGKLTILEPYVDVQSGDTMLALGKTLCDGTSVISVDISLDQMQKLTEEAVTDGGADIEMILTGDGTVVTHSDINEVGKKYGETDESLGDRIVSMISGSDDRYFEFDFEDQHYIVYDVQFQDDWHCISVYDATSVFGSLTGILIATIAVIVATVLIIGSILAVLGRRGIIAERAIASSEAKSAFLSRMSHEIRTPINAMLGMNEMILRESKDRAILDYSERIKQAGQTLLGMVDSILHFSRSETGEREGQEAAAGESADGPDAVRESFRAPGARILVVDDNSMNLVVFQSL